jgi:hypothetical protein
MHEARLIFWRIHRRDIPWAILRMGMDRRALKRSGLDFWKLLGTGSGETFTLRDANPLRWGVLIVGDRIPNFDHWDKRAISRKEIVIVPISVNGLWSGRNPFNKVERIDGKSWHGPVAAITRARIKWRHNRIFWRSVPPVNIALHAAPGLIRAIGIGEAPIGLQGTFSIWQSPQAIKEFAYASPAHQGAIESTRRIGWYSEEMFARFAITAESGEW